MPTVQFVAQAIKRRNVIDITAASGNRRIESTIYLDEIEGESASDIEMNFAKWIINQPTKEHENLQSLKRIFEITFHVETDPETGETFRVVDSVSSSAVV
jgi:hypothetical protein